VGVCSHASCPTFFSLPALCRVIQCSCRKNAGSAQRWLPLASQHVFQISKSVLVGPTRSSIWPHPTLLGIFPNSPSGFYWTLGPSEAPLLQRRLPLEPTLGCSSFFPGYYSSCGSTWTTLRPWKFVVWPHEAFWPWDPRRPRLLSNDGLVYTRFRASAPCSLVPFRCLGSLIFVWLVSPAILVLQFLLPNALRFAVSSFWGGVCAGSALPSLPGRCRFGLSSYIWSLLESQASFGFVSFPLPMP